MAEPSLPLPRLMETAARLAPFVFGTPPLAALHTMTEKAPSSLSFPSPTAAFHPITASMKSLNFTSNGAATPFSINDILSRPDAVAQHHLLSNVSRFAAYNAGLYLHRLGKPLTDVAGLLGTAPPFYWPTGLLPAPMWRDSSAPTSLSSSSPTQSSSDSSGSSATDKDGKKKHTRPTFSGQQIFALEKTFEQTKYLAGPERARLAYALGMTESQVKVWFQNRRTKWRKKHAAEMVAAKRRQESQVDQHFSPSHHHILHTPNHVTMSKETEHAHKRALGDVEDNVDSVKRRKTEPDEAANLTSG